LGFGLAGVFMLFGLLQFYFARSIFDGLELKKPKKNVADLPVDDGKSIPFTTTEKFIAFAGVVSVLIWIIDGLFEVVTRGKHLFPAEIFSFDLHDFTVVMGVANIAAIVALVLFVYLGLTRLFKFDKIERDRIAVIFIFASFVVFFWASFEQAGTSMTIFARDYTDRVVSGTTQTVFQTIDFVLSLAPLVILTYVIWQLAVRIAEKYTLTVSLISVSFLIVWGLAIWRLYHEYSQEQTEVAASWFQVLNPFFIITLAPLFSKLWERVSVPGPLKFAMGLTLLASGFAVLAWGASGIPKGAETASVSMMWLVLAYLLHTLGELSISPVGLSYVSKLAPARMIAFIFGIWYIFTALANKLAGTMAGYMDDIAAKTGLSGFFLIFTFVPLGAALVLVLLNKKIQKMMHGIE
jgi:POT family proton-dependent oligopeptide transporter